MSLHVSALGPYTITNNVDVVLFQIVQADKYGVPRICFVNKMDRMGADFFNTVKMIVSNLGATPAVLQVHCAGLCGTVLWKSMCMCLAVMKK